MSCDDTVMGRGWVCSKGLAATPNFVRLTGWMSANKVDRARGTVEMRSDTGSTQLAPGYVVSNDPDAPGNSAKLGSKANLMAEGIQYPDGYTDLSGALANQLFVAWGVMVSQDADGAIQGCMASIRIDVQGR